MSVYQLCTALYRRRLLTKEKLDVYYANDRLTAGQYEELLNLIGEKKD